MATLESDKVWSALEVKLGCEVDEAGSDHVQFFVKDQNTCLSRTRISKGAKHTLGETLVSLMGKQLGLGGGGNLVKFEKCTLSKEDALRMIRANLPPKAPPSAAQPAVAKKPRK